MIFQKERVVCVAAAVVADRGARGFGHGAQVGDQFVDRLAGEVGVAFQAPCSGS